MGDIQETVVVNVKLPYRLYRNGDCIAAFATEEDQALFEETVDQLDKYPRDCVDSMSR